MLTICYLLTAKGKLILQKQGHGVFFVKYEKMRKISHERGAYSKVKFLNNINENTAAFDMDPFYLEVRCNGYRGSIVPYTKEEINYLADLIEPLRPKTRLDILTLMNAMDYSHRFHPLPSPRVP